MNEQAAAIVEMATFHPKYRFEGSTEDDATNYTNRSPYPILHLLREDQVEEAIRKVEDPAKIWEKNIATTRELGVDAMRRTMEACITPSSGVENPSRDPR